MKYLDLFFNHLKLIHYNKSTIFHYSFYLKKTESYFDLKNLTDEKMITEKHLTDYVLHLKNIQVKDFFYYRTISHLKRYFTFLENEKIIFINPMSDIEIPKAPKIPTKPVKKDELFNILLKINTETAYGIRSKAVFETLYSTAMRPFELTNVKIINVDFNKEEIFIERGKYLKDRVVPVGKIALYWIERYLSEVRAKYIKDKSNPYLFITLDGTSAKLTVRGLQQIFRYTLKINNLNKIKLYSLRSSSAVHCLLNGMDIIYIQKLLGHNSVTTTKSYLQLDTLDLQAILKKSHPRNKFKGENHEI